MAKFFRDNKAFKFLRGIFLPVYDKSVYYIKFHKLLTAMWTLFVIMALVLCVALKGGWGVDKSVMGFYFDPEIEDCTDDNVMALVNGYYIAYVSGDTETIKSLSIDPENVEAVKAKDQVIEYFENFYLHWVKGAQDNTYVLYVYWEVKFMGIDTAAPGIETFYLIEKDGSFFIKNKLDAEEKEFMSALKESGEDVDLYAKTDANLNKALEDTKLKELYDFLLGSSK